MRIAVVGTGYVGLVAGTCFAESGHLVHGVDVDERKIAVLREGRSTIYEPGLEELLQKNLAARRLQFGADLAAAVGGSELVFIAVGTPQGESGDADLHYVLTAAEQIGKAIRKYTIIVNKSTVPVGTADEVRAVVARNTVLNLLGLTLPLVVAIATVPITVRALGVERFGILALAWIVLGYFGLFDLGLGRATTRFAAEALSLGQTDRFARLMWTSIGLQAGLGLTGAAVLLGMAPFIGEIFGIRFDVRHITISSGNTALAIYGLGIHNIERWYLVTVLLGVLGIGFFNFLVSFSLAFFVAVRNRTLVAPPRPHPPLTGTNTIGSAPTNSSCCSGVNLTIPHVLSG